MNWHYSLYYDFDFQFKVCSDVLNTSVALSVSEDGVPTFATMVSKVRHWTISFIILTGGWDLLTTSFIIFTGGWDCGAGGREWSHLHWPQSGAVPCQWEDSTWTKQGMCVCMSKSIAQLIFSFKLKKHKKFLSQGWSLLMWARKNKFCSVCGTEIKRY